MLFVVILEICILQHAIGYFKFLSKIAMCVNVVAMHVLVFGLKPSPRYRLGPLIQGYLQYQYENTGVCYTELSVG